MHFKTHYELNDKTKKEGSQIEKSERGSDKFTILIPNGLRDAMLERCKKDRITPSELITTTLNRYLFTRDYEEEKIKRMTSLDKCQSSKSGVNQ